MSNITLPRPLSDYFAFNEDEASGGFRRFGLYFPYRSGSGSVERLRWIWKIAGAEAARLTPEAFAARKQAEVQRFTRIIEWWVWASDQTLSGDEPIPQLRPRAAAAPGAPPILRDAAVPGRTALAGAGPGSRLRA